jgi:hypothetical protein
MDHDYCDEFKCPVCDRVDHDAWELPDSDDEHECSCGAILSFERQVSISWLIAVVEKPDGASP